MSISWIKYSILFASVVLGGLFTSTQIPLYLVHEGEMAIHLRMGRFHRTCKQKGLYYKVPFIDTIFYVSEEDHFLCDAEDRIIVCDTCHFPLSIYDDQAQLCEDKAYCSECLWDEDHQNTHSMMDMDLINTAKERPCVKS